MSTTVTGNLREYERKRDFSKTPEPKGRKGAGENAKELRFAVQHHLASRDHYDFRLEWDGVLLSWAVPKGPSYNPKDKRLAVHVEDHPLDYRDFEGTIPKGEYGGGTVMLWDEGTWKPLSDPGVGLRKGSLKMELRGKRLKGKWALVRMKDEAEKDLWLLTKERDEYAMSEPGIERFDKGVRSGRTMAQIARGTASVKPNPFDTLSVQLAKSAPRVPEGEDWIYEIKFDGYRMVTFAEDGKVRIVSRNGHDYTARFESAAEALRELSAGRSFVVDGEMIVADDEGRSDFQELQNALRRRRPANLRYMLFDLPALNGEDLRDKPLAERKEMLRSLLQNAPPVLQYSDHVQGKGREFFEAARRMNLEGVVAKRKSAPYRGTRTDDWLKIKCGAGQEFVVGGYTRTEKKQKGVSAVLLGVYEEGRFVCVGRAGTGFSEALGAELEAKFRKHLRKTCPFVNEPKIAKGETVFWLTPKFLAEVRFAEWTADGRLRQAVFKGLRDDKAPADVRRETASRGDEPEAADPPRKTAPKAASRGRKTAETPEAPRLTNPDKIMYPDRGITKGDVADYYARAAERMLPYVANRILSVIRCPKGIEGERFFKKHPTVEAGNVTEVEVRSAEGKTETYFCVRNAAELLSEVQMNTLEFHVWGSRADDPDRPDLMVFDLDPDEGLDLERIRQGVRDLKKILDSLGLRSFLKTSGGKGYHVAVPMTPAEGWEEFKDFARGVAAAMVEAYPDRYTDNQRKERRKGKIFIDWMRNGKGATGVAPYSLRARPGAPVSMPIRWSELDKIGPADIDLREALQRMRLADPWKGFFEVRQGLKSAGKSARG